METTNDFDTMTDAFARLRDAMDELQETLTTTCACLYEALEQEEAEPEPNE